MPQIIKTTNAKGEQVVYDYGNRYSDENRKDRRRVAVRKGFVYAEMMENHHEIARRILLGETNVKIARDLGISEVTISNVKNSPVVKEKLAVMRAARDAGTINLANEIIELAPIALDRIKEVLETGKTLERNASAASILKEANNIIDRVQGKPTQTIHTKNMHAHFNADDINDIKERARELAAATNQMAE